MSMTAPPSGGYTPGWAGDDSIAKTDPGASKKDKKRQKRSMAGKWGARHDRKGPKVTGDPAAAAAPVVDPLEQAARADAKLAYDEPIRQANEALGLAKTQRSGLDIAYERYQAQARQDQIAQQAADAARHEQLNKDLAVGQTLAAGILSSLGGESRPTQGEGPTEGQQAAAQGVANETGVGGAAAAFSGAVDALNQSQAKLASDSMRGQHLVAAGAADRTVQDALGALGQLKKDKGQAVVKAKADRGQQAVENELAAQALLADDKAAMLKYREAMAALKSNERIADANNATDLTEAQIKAQTAATTAAANNATKIHVAEIAAAVKKATASGGKVTIGGHIYTSQQLTDAQSAAKDLQAAVNEVNKAYRNVWDLAKIGSIMESYSYTDEHVQGAIRALALGKKPSGVQKRALAKLFPNHVIPPGVLKGAKPKGK